MGEVLFYHLTATPLSRSLPELLTRTLHRGWRAVVRAADPPRLAMVDDMLWTFDQASFLPHGTAALGSAEAQPVYLTCGTENPARANVLMLVEGARFSMSDAQDFERICMMFDGHAADAVQAARADWVSVRDAGLTGRYWAQVDGKWTEKATTGE
ncbi:MAG: DNA polymerase III subunit chi [Pseudomonadota bacterium]